MFRYFVISFFTVSVLMAQTQTINFAPLPMVKSQKLLEQYLPMLKYLESKVNIKFNIIYARNYDDIIHKLGNAQIDLAFLGPLPYVEATSRYTHIKPLVRFLDPKGKSHYTCSMFKLIDNPLTLRGLHKKHFALTQKYSTCGYLATQKILYDYNSSLKQNPYRFVGSHTNAILEVVLGNSDIGTAKSSIVEQYSHFEIQTIAKSEPFPSFLLVYQNQKINPQTILQIKQALMQLTPLSNPKDANITKSWGKNLKYGVIAAKDSDYSIIRKLLKSIELPQ